jgi:VWFA-related protein
VHDIFWKVIAMRRTVALTSVLLASTTWWVAAQQAGPASPGASQTSQTPTQPRLTFRVESNYVEVDAVVTDGQGNIVRDLKRDDFDVLEDGRPQTVEAFAFVELPVERADRPLFRPTAVEPDVSTNVKPFDGRVYLLVLDGYHVDPIRTPQVKQQAKAFLEGHFGANDIGAVVHIGNPGASQEFTWSRRLLEASVDKFSGQKLQSSALNKMADLASKTTGKLVDPEIVIEDTEMPARAAQAEATLGSLRALAQYMAGVRGRRKAVLLFSEGIDFNTDDVIGGDQRNASNRTPYDSSRDAQSVRDAQTDMLGAATRSNVSIYTIDPRGVAGPDDVIKQGGLPQDPAAAAGVSVQPPTMDILTEIERAQGTLRVFAEQTGGLAHVGSNNFAAAFAKIADDNSFYYVLGYYAPTVKHDGKFHNLSVRVKRPSLQVRARKGYFAPKDTGTTGATPPPDVLHQLLASPMPIGGLPMRVAAQVMKGTTVNARVCLTVEVDGRDFPLAEKNGSLTNRLELSYAAYDVNAKPIASGLKTLDLTIKPDNKGAVTDHGLRLTTEFDIAPGRYQLRLAGHETLGDRSGSVYRDLEVPAFTDAPLMMSDLLVTSSTAGMWATTSDAASLKDLLPGPVTAQRSFSLDEMLAIFATVYDNDAAHLHTDDLTATVRTSDGTQVFIVRDERDTKALASTNGSFGYLAHIPLQDLVPGEYILTVEAHSRLGGKPAVKEIQFTVH